MVKSKHTPLTAPRAADPSNYGLLAVEWVAAVFDSAIYFFVIRMRGIPFPMARNEFATISEAVTFARSKLDEGPCVYAMSPHDRSALLPRDWWDEWIQREATQ